MRKYLLLFFSLSLSLAFCLYLRLLPATTPNLKNNSSQPYLSELDCWQWAHQTENVLQLNRVGDTIQDGHEINSFTLIPKGARLSWFSFLPRCSAWLYRIFVIFNSSTPLFTFLYYLPLLFFALLFCALYLITYARWGNTGALIASLFVGISPPFLPRSCIGWFDTDILNLLFPLLISATYLRSFEAASWKLSLAWIGCASLCVGVFAFTWGYWWFIWIILIAYELFVLAFTMALPRASGANSKVIFRRHALHLTAFITFSSLCILLLCKNEPFIYLYAQIKNSFILNVPSISFCAQCTLNCRRTTNA